MKKTRILRLLAAVMALFCLTALLAGCGGNKTKYVVLEENFGSEEYGVGFRKTDTALALEVQKILDEMVADGTAGKIATEWFDSDVYLKDKAFPRDLGAASDSSLEDLKARGVFVVGLDVGFKPMGYYDDAGEIVGFDIDLAKEVAKRLGVEFKAQPIDWAAKEMELDSGNIDCIWNGMSINPERVEAMNIIKPYLANRMVIIVAEDSGIATKADLAGKKVAVQAGSTALDAINGEPEVAATFGEIVEFVDNPTAFLDLKAGRVDALVVDEVVGRNLIAED